MFRNHDFCKRSLKSIPWFPDAMHLRTVSRTTELLIVNNEPNTDHSARTASDLVRWMQPANPAGSHNPTHIPYDLVGKVVGIIADQDNKTSILQLTLYNKAQDQRIFQE